jgi:hypothetical protein
MAEDTRGPYLTVERCEERTVEMGKDIIQGIPGHYPVQSKCVVSKGEET